MFDMNYKNEMKNTCNAQILMKNAPRISEKTPAELWLTSTNMTVMGGPDQATYYNLLQK